MEVKFLFKIIHLHTFYKAIFGWLFAFGKLFIIFIVCKIFSGEKIVKVL